MKSTDNLGLFGTLIGAAAASGNIATVPDTQATSGDGTASIALGFPPETFIDRAAGGEPPRGQDMNGFLNRISRAIQVLQAGYFGPFDTSFATAIGGYPSGAIVSGTVVGTFWVSTADNNTSTPGADGATWQSLFTGLLTPATADARYVRGIWNATTDQRILSIARNKANSGIYVQFDDNTNQRLQIYGDYATNTALSAETTRATTAESNLQSSKVNRDGDTMTGSLNINTPGGGVIASGNGGGDNVPGGIAYAAGLQSAISIGSTAKAFYRLINVNGVGPFATIWLTGNDGSAHELRFGADDRLRTASGNIFALTSELPVFPCNLSENGWQKLPSGLIIQWGQSASNGTYSFPTTFPNSCFCIVPGNTTSQGSYVDNAFAYAVNNSQFYIATKASNTGTVTGFPASWFALGY